MLAECARLMTADAGTTQGLAVLDMPRLKGAHDLLLNAKVIAAPVDFNTAFAPKFWEAVPAADKKM
jgi:hypothetical protein